jgi:hypothetical protein
MNQSAQTQADMAALKQMQKRMGYSDEQMQSFLQNPRNKRILAQREEMAKINVVFEIVKAEGCALGHQAGEKFVFPKCGAMDLKSSAPKLCAFLMPPMTRLTWLIHERMWEGLEPMPLFEMGQCDDVGADCGGWGRVLIQARIEKAE